MPRKARFVPGGLVYHVTNRTWGKMALFKDDEDYLGFEQLLADAVEREKSMRICAYCLMPDHFHLVLWPAKEGQLSRFMQWLTMTHVARWHSRRRSIGRGRLYNSRFKTFAVEPDEHFLDICRHVERNAVRLKLVRRAEKWRWSSLWVRLHDDEAPMKKVLADWPVKVPRDWVERVNKPQSENELAAIRLAGHRSRPYGQEKWVRKTAAKLGMESSLRPIGRPRKTPVAARTARTVGK
jgi:putative transposase